MPTQNIVANALGYMFAMLIGGAYGIVSVSSLSTGGSSEIEDQLQNDTSLRQRTAKIAIRIFQSLPMMIVIGMSCNFSVISLTGLSIMPAIPLILKTIIEKVTDSKKAHTFSNILGKIDKTINIIVKCINILGAIISGGLAIYLICMLLYFSFFIHAEIVVIGFAVFLLLISLLNFTGIYFNVASLIQDVKNISQCVKIFFKKPEATIEAK